MVLRLYPVYPFIKTMHKLLNTSTANIPTGVSPQRKLFRLKYGIYAGRLVCLYGESPGGITLAWSDPPYRSWSSNVDLIEDSADYPFSACIDGNGNLYIVYVQQTSLDLIFIKLVFNAGAWSIGEPVTILNVGSVYYPSITRSADGKLWCAYAYYDSGSDEYYVRVKSSADGGLTWGSGPSDTGTQLSGSSLDMPYVNLSFMGNNLYAVYSQGRSDLYYRKYDGLEEQWESAVLVLSSNYIDSDFDCAVSDDLRLGITMSSSGSAKLYFRELDGVTMSGLQEVALYKTRAPQIVYNENKPLIFYARDVGNSIYFPCYAYKDNGNFITNELIAGVGFFDKVFVYDDSAQTKFEDKTQEASNTQEADIYHSSSNTLIEMTGDCLYIGMEEKYFCVAIILSTIGSGGIVVWEYYDGDSWVSFSPQSGDYNFDLNSKIVFLWNDLESVPESWQSNTVNSEYMFWIRIRVVSPFVTAPVGSQIIASPKTNHLALSREAQ
ncbi:MAG: hypothetical protein B6D58_03750 [candidate division Zixibacteria bacterium 4484_95]|nr:MAG: hypothetical protein B6D58_03750 [candidate division Zixibacteria bacterium 4484_95]